VAREGALVTRGVLLPHPVVSKRINGAAVMHRKKWVLLNSGLGIFKNVRTGIKYWSCRSICKFGNDNKLSIDIENSKEFNIRINATQGKLQAKMPTPPFAIKDGVFEVTVPYKGPILELDDSPLTRLIVDALNNYKPKEPQYFNI